MFGINSIPCVRLIALLLLLLSCAVTPATSVLAPTFGRLVASADLIFTGQILAQRCEWQERRGRRSIVTLVTVGVESIHKGQAESVVTLQFLGGKVGDVSLEVAEMPRFNNGERAVLFVEGNGTNASALVGFYHGRFPLRRESDGPDRVLHHDGKPLLDVADIGRTATAQRSLKPALTHDEFIRRLQGVLNGSRPE